MKIAVCDDFQEERSILIPLLQEFLSSHNLTAECEEYDSGEALLSGFIPDEHSLIFLDIYMDGMSGIEAARHLKAQNPNCVIILTTTSQAHGAEAFDIDAFHYLVKPIKKEKLFTVMNKWYETLCEIKTIEFKYGRTVKEVFLRDILYIDVLGRNSTIHTLSETFEISASLSAIEEMLPSDEFFRPIRYCLVSLIHIQSISKEYLTLDNNEKIVISRNERHLLKEKLASYRLRRLRRR